MNKEYTYLEVIEEIFKDKSKMFRCNKIGETMFFNKGTNSLNIRLNSANIMEELIVNDNWINSKWTLVEEKKKYNIRVYDVYNNRLLSSKNVIMTEVEMKTYCNNKIIWEECNINIISTIEIYDTSIPIKRAITKVVCEIIQ